MFDFPGTGGSGNSWLPPTMAHNALFTKMLLRKLGLPAGRRPRIFLGWRRWPSSWRSSTPARCAGSSWPARPSGSAASRPARRVSARMLTPRRYYSRAYFTKIAPTLYGGRYRTDPPRRGGHHPPCRPAPSVCMATPASSPRSCPIRACSACRWCRPDAGPGRRRRPDRAEPSTQMMAALLRHSTLQMIPGAGHLVLFDSPEIAAPR